MPTKEMLKTTIFDIFQKQSALSNICRNIRLKNYCFVIFNCTKHFHLIFQHFRKNLPGLKSLFFRQTQLFSLVFLFIFMMLHTFQHKNYLLSIFKILSTNFSFELAQISCFFTHIRNQQNLSKISINPIVNSFY